METYAGRNVTHRRLVDDHGCRAHNFATREAKRPRPVLTECHESLHSQVQSLFYRRDQGGDKIERADHADRPLIFIDNQQSVNVFAAHDARRIDE